MKLALDFDGTITAHPEVLLFLADSWIKNGGQLYILTARKKDDRELTHVQLATLGFEKWMYQLECYPFNYPWPFKDPEEEARWKAAHASWKVAMCQGLGIDVLYDDCPVNTEACRAAGVRIFQIHS